MGFGEQHIERKQEPQAGALAPKIDGCGGVYEYCKAYNISDRLREAVNVATAGDLAGLSPAAQIAVLNRINEDLQVRLRKKEPLEKAVREAVRGEFPKATEGNLARMDVTPWTYFLAVEMHRQIGRFQPVGPADVDNMSSFNGVDAESLAAELEQAGVNVTAPRMIPTPEITMVPEYRAPAASDPSITPTMNNTV